MKKKNIIILLVITIIALVGIGLCLPKVFKEKEDNKKSDIPEEVAPNEEQKETPVEPEEPEEKHHIDSTDPLIIDGILIVNKSYPLSADYIPESSHEAVNGRDYCVFGLKVVIEVITYKMEFIIEMLIVMEKKKRILIVRDQGIRNIKRD